jgi:hypothetical protein
MQIATALEEKVDMIVCGSQGCVQMRFPVVARVIENKKDCTLEMMVRW